MLQGTGLELLGHAGSARVADAPPVVETAWHRPFALALPETFVPASSWCSDHGVRA